MLLFNVALEHSLFSFCFSILSFLSLSQIFSVAISSILTVEFSLFNFVVYNLKYYDQTFYRNQN